MAETRLPLPETAAQTAGPYVHIGLAPRVAGFDPYGRDLGAAIGGPAPRGAAIRVCGIVRDGLGQPVRDAVIEVWQANAAGIYRHPRDPRAGEVEPGFRGWGRVSADLETGEWAFETVKPGRAAGPDGRAMAPHLALWIAARGINLGLLTRLYFPDEAAANAEDAVLAKAGPRAATLIAAEAGPGAYRFEIRLQGEDETVFFDV